MLGLGHCVSFKIIAISSSFAHNPNIRHCTVSILKVSSYNLWKIKNYDSKNTQEIFLKRLNGLVFIIKTHYTFCEVGTEFININRTFVHRHSRFCYLNLTLYNRYCLNNIFAVLKNKINLIVGTALPCYIEKLFNIASIIRVYT
jgi:hypothetical protein